ncbi:MAG: 2-C-methyl-D-erythritol 4-phosphate cytidylyltransferase [Bacteroidaceae bacterium]|nr:2-C-methyl-D-erythritol 4-phosphate cytidylyltransferase [Bacteroidaceae bacterium]
MNKKVIALILAGGKGERVSPDRPKQYLEVRGESVLQHTLRAFQGLVDEVVVVCQDEWREYVEKCGASLAVPCRTATGGCTGFESLCNGVAALADEAPDTLVAIHDAVRPLVTEDVITDNLAVARRCGNAITAVDTYETLLHAPNGETVRSMIRREGMYRAQTPQTFTLATLRQMIGEARRRCVVNAQSACTMATQLGYQLHLSKGDLLNFKITLPSDMLLYESLIP